VALALFRGVQEALTNVRKHTQATRVEVELDFLAADTVRLSVSDNGGGAETLSGGFGLVGLRERAQLLGGELCVNTVPDGGVQLEMRLPG
jgi:signal transduction histidine kinase